MLRTLCTSTVALTVSLLALTPAAAQAVEILRPMYLDPTTDFAAWEQVASSCAAGTPITVVLNAHNGPGFAGDDMPNTAYEDAVRLLDDSGCTLLGYVATGGQSPAARINPPGSSKYEQDCVGVSECLSDIWFELNRWSTDWAVDGAPRIDGFFFDEVNASPDNLVYYQWISLMVTSYLNGPALTSKKQVVFNAGGPASWFEGGDNQAYVDLADVYVVLEQTGATYQGFDIPADLESYAPEKLAVLAHSTPTIEQMNELVEKAAAEELGYVMVTSGAWHQTDSHWDAFVDAMTPPVDCQAELMEYCFDAGYQGLSYPGQCVGASPQLVTGFCIIIEGACYGEYLMCG